MNHLAEMYNIESALLVALRTDAFPGFLQPQEFQQPKILPPTPYDILADFVLNKLPVHANEFAIELFPQARLAQKRGIGCIGVDKLYQLTPYHIVYHRWQEREQYACTIWTGKCDSWCHTLVTVEVDGQDSEYDRIQCEVKPEVVYYNGTWVNITAGWTKVVESLKQQVGTMNNLAKKEHNETKRKQEQEAERRELEVLRKQATKLPKTYYQTPQPYSVPFSSPAPTQAPARTATVVPAPIKAVREEELKRFSLLASERNVFQRYQPSHEGLAQAGLRVLCPESTKLVDTITAFPDFSEPVNGLFGTELGKSTACTQPTVFPGAALYKSTVAPPSMSSDCNVTMQPSEQWEGFYKNPEKTPHATSYGKDSMLASVVESTFHDEMSDSGSGRKRKLTAGASGDNLQAKKARPQVSTIARTSMTPTSALESTPPPMSSYSTQVAGTPQSHAFGHTHGSGYRNLNQNELPDIGSYYHNRNGHTAHFPAVPRPVPCNPAPSYRPPPTSYGNGHGNGHGYEMHSLQPGHQANHGQSPSPAPMNCAPAIDYAPTINYAPVINHAPTMNYTPAMNYTPTPMNCAPAMSYASTPEHNTPPTPPSSSSWSMLSPLPPHNPYPLSNPHAVPYLYTNHNPHPFPPHNNRR